MKSQRKCEVMLYDVPYFHDTFFDEYVTLLSLETSILGVITYVPIHAVKGEFM